MDLLLGTASHRLKIKALLYEHGWPIDALEQLKNEDETIIPPDAELAAIETQVHETMSTILHEVKLYIYKEVHSFFFLTGINKT